MNGKPSLLLIVSIHLSLIFIFINECNSTGLEVYQSQKQTQNIQYEPVANAPSHKTMTKFRSADTPPSKSGSFSGSHSGSHKAVVAHRSGVKATSSSHTPKHSHKKRRKHKKHRAHSRRMSHKRRRATSARKAHKKPYSPVHSTAHSPDPKSRQLNHQKTLVKSASVKAHV